MTCCGQGRTSFARASPPRPAMAQAAPRAAVAVPPRAAVAAPRPAAPPPPAAYAAVRLRYLERSPIAVRGQASGRYYEFSAADAVKPVDPRDAAALLRTRFFQQVR
jgi:hypothetical protein